MLVPGMSTLSFLTRAALTASLDSETCREETKVRTKVYQRETVNLSSRGSLNGFLPLPHSELIPTIYTAGSGADRQGFLDSPPSPNADLILRIRPPAYPKSLPRHGN